MAAARAPPPPPTPTNLLAIIASSPTPSAAAVLLACLGGALVTYAGAALVPRLPPGGPRLAAVAPLVAVLAALPLAPPPSVVARGALAFVCWLAASKLLALAGGRGALALPGLTTVQRALLLALPITPLASPSARHHHHQRSSSAAAAASTNGHTQPEGDDRASKPVSAPPPAPPAPSSSPTALQTAALDALNLSLLAACILLLRADDGGGGGGAPIAGLSLPRLVRHALYAAVVYLSVSLVLDAPAPLVLGWALPKAAAAASPSASPPSAPLSSPSSSAIAGLAPSMRAPWAARSLASFWAHHYNVAVSEVLRHAAYAPVVEGGLVKQDAARHAAGGASASHERPPVSAARRTAGLVLVFLMSGLAHEVIVSGYMCAAADEQRRLAGGPAESARRPGLMLSFFLAQVPALLLEQRAREWSRERARRRQAQKEKEGAGEGAAASPAAAAAAAGAAAGAGRGSSSSSSGRVSARVCSVLSNGSRAALTLLALLFMTDVGFFPALEACGVDRAGIAEIGGVVDAAGAWLSARLQRRAG